MSYQPVSFDNAEHAFALRSDEDLRRMNFLLSAMRFRLLVKIGTVILPLVTRVGTPVTRFIRNTVYKQFVGGETLEETVTLAQRLSSAGVQVILDYAVERSATEENFDAACSMFVRVANYAASQKNIPFISIKITALARFSLLNKLDSAAFHKNGYTGHIHTEALDEDESAEWGRVHHRMEKIISAAAAGGVSVLVDAEESWIQDPVDALTMQLMAKYNRQRPVVYNTIQLYRSDRLSFLKSSFEWGARNQFITAVKIVRGAYMEKERKRAKRNGYVSPIHPNKQAVDDDFNHAIKFCIARSNRLAVVVATHNEESNLLALHCLNQRQSPTDLQNIHFSQLYGMSDHITFNLAQGGFSVSKFVPFGPLTDVIPYLTRRASENSSVSGQTGRELALIRKEISRRKHL